MSFNGLLELDFQVARKRDLYHVLKYSILSSLGIVDTNGCKFLTVSAEFPPSLRLFIRIPYLNDLETCNGGNYIVCYPLILMCPNSI